MESERKAEYKCQVIASRFLTRPAFALASPFPFGALIKGRERDGVRREARERKREKVTKNSLVNVVSLYIIACIVEESPLARRGGDARMS